MIHVVQIKYEGFRPQINVEVPIPTAVYVRCTRRDEHAHAISRVVDPGVRSSFARFLDQERRSPNYPEPDRGETFNSPVTTK